MNKNLRIRRYLTGTSKLFSFIIWKSQGKISTSYNEIKPLKYFKCSNLSLMETVVIFEITNWGLCINLSNDVNQTCYINFCFLDKTLNHI